MAANLGLAGLGTDTGNSVRGPSGHCSLVGLRPSLGLVSRRACAVATAQAAVHPVSAAAQLWLRLLAHGAGQQPQQPSAQPWCSRPHAPVRRHAVWPACMVTQLEASPCTPGRAEPHSTLVRRKGVIPLDTTSDTVGPIARSVADVAALLQAMAGYDAGDALTSLAQAQPPPDNYTQFLRTSLQVGPPARAGCRSCPVTAALCAHTGFCRSRPGTAALQICQHWRPQLPGSHRAARPCSRRPFVHARMLQTSMCCS